MRRQPLKILINTLAIFLFMQGCAKSEENVNYREDTKQMAREQGLPENTPVRASGNSLDILCASKPISTEQWVNWAPAVFTGKVIERKLRMTPWDDNYFDGCWVKFAVDKQLKGNLPRAFWGKEHYWGYPVKDKMNTKNCYFEEGKKYLVFARTFESDLLSNKNETYFTTATNRGGGGGYICPPSQAFPAAQKTFDEVQEILKGKKK